MADMLTAIIVAGGSSRRMGFDKTFALLAGKPVIAHTIAAFEATPAVEEIVVVARQDRVAELQSLISGAAFAKTRTVVAGGLRRQDSVAAGLAAISARADFIAVHDAARLLITPKEIARVFDAARLHAAAALAAPVTDTLKRAVAGGMVVAAMVERDNLFAMQTPQIFARTLLLDGYREVAAQGATITDEMSAVEHLGHPVVLVASEDYNFKITFPADLELAEFVLGLRQTAREPQVGKS